MELHKTLKRFGKICLWTSACFFVVLVLLYVARIPLTISVLESSGKDQNLFVECLDWNLTFTPSLRISKICLSSDSAKITVNNVNWPLLGQTLDIQQLAITHIQSTQTKPNDSPSINLDGFTLPANLPLIQVDNLFIDSYLLEKPMALSIQQDSTHSLLVTGDIDARINFLETDSGNSLQANINWVPARMISAIPQLKAIMVDFDPYLGLQQWKQTPINSKFSIANSKLYSSHTLAVEEQLKYQGCSASVAVTGSFATVTSTGTLLTQIDLSQLAITFTIDDCEALTILSEDLATEALSFVAENPIEITPTELNMTNVTIRDSLSPSKLAITLLNAEYQFDDKKPSVGQYLIQLDMPYTSSVASTTIKASVTGEFKLEAGDIFVSANADNLELANLSFNAETSAKTSRVFGNAMGQYQSGMFTASGDISTEEIHLVTSQVSSSGNQAVAVIKSVTSQFEVTESQVQDIKLVLTNKISKVSYDNARVAQINNRTSATLTQLNELEVNATSEIRKPQVADISLKSIAIAHKIRASINNSDNIFSTSGSHEFKTNSGLFGNIVHDISAKTSKINVELPEQSILPLQPQLATINQDTTLKSGQFAGNMQYDIDSSEGLGSLSLEDLNIDYGEYKVRGVNMDEKFTISSAELQLSNAKISIDLVDVGVPINDITVVVSAIKNTFKLQEAKGDIFGGQFMLGEFWLDGRDQELKISAADLSLAQLAALQEQSGIDVTGELGGNLPLIITAGKFKIDNATLATEQPGKLKIKGNPAFDSIKENQQQLALLENLNYEKLKTNVTLTPDGWLKLDFSILGRNPDKNQAVNFNYGHEENIFTLLKALRITNSVQQGLEKKIENKYSDKK